MHDELIPSTIYHVFHPGKEFFPDGYLAMEIWGKSRVFSVHRLSRYVPGADNDSWLTLVTSIEDDGVEASESGYKERKQSEILQSGVVTFSPAKHGFELLINPDPGRDDVVADFKNDFNIDVVDGMLSPVSSIGTTTPFSTLLLELAMKPGLDNVILLINSSFNNRSVSRARFSQTAANSCDATFVQMPPGGDKGELDFRVSILPENLRDSVFHRNTDKPHDSRTVITIGNINAYYVDHMDAWVFFDTSKAELVQNVPKDFASFAKKGVTTKSIKKGVLA